MQKNIFCFWTFQLFFFVISPNFTNRQSILQKNFCFTTVWLFKHCHSKTVSTSAFWLKYFLNPQYSDWNIFKVSQYAVFRQKYFESVSIPALWLKNIPKLSQAPGLWPKYFKTFLITTSLTEIFKTVSIPSVLTEIYLKCHPQCSDSNIIKLSQSAVFWLKYFEIFSIPALWLTYSKYVSINSTFTEIFWNCLNHQHSDWIIWNCLNPQHSGCNI